jgi:hypothetical protein
MVEDLVRPLLAWIGLLISRLAHLLMSLHRLVIHWLEYVVSASILMACCVILGLA